MIPSDYLANLLKGQVLPSPLETRLQDWFSLGLPFNLNEEVLLLLEKNQKEEISDRFLNPLCFGTAGIRSCVGAGFSYLNEYTIAKISFEVGRSLKKDENRPIVISYDSRHFSLHFARIAAQTFLFQGFSVILFAIPTPSPILAYATRFYNALAGVMITASHNPKGDNGYKVYNSQGGQLNSLQTEKIALALKETTLIPWNEIKKTSLMGLEAPDVQMLLSYFKEVQKYLPNFSSIAEYVQIVYSPLMGTGKHYAKEMIEFLGGKLYLNEEENRYDGNFGNLSSPNPELPEVFQRSIALAHSKNIPLCIVTDPDSDRLGLWEEGYFFNGNEIGILLAFFLLEYQVEKRQKLLVSSIVSTQLTEKIAHYWGSSYKQTPTGFKYIGALIEDDPDSFLFGFEESGGFLIGPYIGDKDAIGTLALLFTMSNYLYAQGNSIKKYLENIYGTVGFSKTQNIELTLNSSKGQDFFNQLQNEHYKIFEHKVLRDLDFKNKTAFHEGKEEPFPEDWKDFPPLNLRIFYLDSHLRLSIRPSGTEAKIKCYLELYLPPKEYLNLQIRKESLKIFSRLEEHLKNLASF